ncbi:uncharacterized protein LOC129743946 [Uranotaenia lowii]|uniref:uncharacterized protein LOC129743946 n=1 Tax=Uranotaenia lowii TaxID=190385 RepID=UPI0024796F5E|nr:uncharacterized protein LOC129743946 [Uranotaenia lowii]
MDPASFNLTRTDLEEILRVYESHSRVLVTEIVGAQVVPFSKSRVGYLGDHFFLEINVTIRKDEGEVKTNESLKFFLKRLSQGIPALAEYLQAIGTCRKEIRLYRDLFPKLSDFSRFAPRAYLGKDDSLLVLENVSSEGFRTITNAKLGIFDKAHLEQALKALARFHCSSLLLETKTGRTLTELFPGALTENCWILNDNNPRVAELENAIKVLCELVKIVEKDNPDLNDILKKLPNFINQIYDLVKPSEKFRNVACHGDLWGSNLMFKYSEENVPIDCLIVDFQFARYAPPAYDLNMLITLTTTGEFRKKHRKQLLDFYYQTLRNEIIQQHLAPDEILPKKQFYDSCYHYVTSGLIDNFLMNHVTLLPRSCVDEIFSSAEQYNNFSGDDKIRMCRRIMAEDPEYRNRIGGIIKDLLEVL